MKVPAVLNLSKAKAGAAFLAAKDLFLPQ